MAQLDGAAIAGSQQRILTMASAVPDGANGVNHMPRGQTVSFGNFSVAGFTPMQHAAFHHELRTSRAMDRAVDATSAEQRAIRGVDNGVNAQGRDVGDDNFKPGLADLARYNAQAEAAALTVTPLSARSCCNSPAWNISRMMSQPPTNSPLT